ncbi:MAG: hypothetical protein GY842_21140 [bacterium]|nr:hypothetical protein [bacterium]
MSGGGEQGVWHRGAWLLATCACVVLGGCGEGAPESEGEVEEEVKPIVKTAERGPVKMTVTSNRNRITIAERLELTIEVFAEEGVEIEMDEPGEQLNEFQIRGFRNIPGELVEGGQRWTRKYDLDIFLSGEYSIPQIEARFIDRRQEDPDQPGEGVIEGTIRTEGFTIEVTSLLEGEFDPTQFRDIKGPVEIPVEGNRAWIAWVAGGGVVVALVAIILVLRRGRKVRATPQAVVIPHEWAFDQLRALIDAKLVEQGQAHEFFFRLSYIVRVYIELRFGLMAPERTTEEFLVEVQRSSVLRSVHKTLLGDFLESCDRVKFAMYEPTAGEIETTFDSARDFVQETASPAEPVSNTAEQAA